MKFKFAKDLSPPLRGGLYIESQISVHSPLTKGTGYLVIIVNSEPYFWHLQKIWGQFYARSTAYFHGFHIVTYRMLVDNAF